MTQAKGNNGLTRADFLKGLGFGVAAGGLVMLTGCSSEDSSEAESSSMLIEMPTWDEETDVIVCGCGNGGAPAAVEAYDAGADVLVVEKMDWLGGCWRRNAGGLVGANTSVQQKLGITDDTSDMLYDYFVACADGQADEDLMRVFADNCGKDIDWIIQDLGGQSLDDWNFSDPESEGYSYGFVTGLNISGSPTYFDELGMPENERPRCHFFTANPDDVDPGDRYYASAEAYVALGLVAEEGFGGTGIWATFEKAFEERGIEVMTETTFTNLVATLDKEVLGVKVVTSDGSEKFIKAKKGVVLATGGYDNDADLLRNFRDEEWMEATEMGMAVGGYLPEQCDGNGTKAALGLGVAPSHISIGKMGGLKINTEAQMVDVFGAVVPRLYASSRLVGGLVGSKYPVCGGYASGVLAMGRIAGRNAASANSWE